MARAVKRHLKVGATPHLDENKLIVRMHETDAPEGVKWGNYISLSANQNRIACKVLSNAMAEVKPPREHQISVNKHLKSKLHIKPGTTVDFYIKKASPLRAPYFIMRYHPDGTVRKRTLLKVLGVAVVLALAATFAALYFLVWQ
jgi:hypothetical protein